MLIKGFGQAPSLVSYLFVFVFVLWLLFADRVDFFFFHY